MTAGLVRQMAAQMEAERKANEFKGGDWQSSSRDEVRHDLLYHVVKLLACEGHTALTEYAADVANCAAIYGSHGGGLRHMQTGNASSYDKTPASDYMHTLASKLEDVLR